MIPQSELPLIVSVDPKIGESIFGLIARATAENVLVRPGILIGQVGSKAPWQYALRSADTHTVDWLSNKLGCHAAEIESRIGDVIPGRNSVLRPRDLEMQRRRISPVSLANSDHHRISWCNRLLPFCPESFELLVHKCQCDAELGWFKTVGLRVCETCHSIVQSSSQFLPLELRDPYAQFAALWSPLTSERSAVACSLAARLRGLHPTALAELALVIGRALTGIDRMQKAEMPMLAAAYAQAELIAVGIENLRSWPQSLRLSVSSPDFVDANGGGGLVTLAKRLRPILKYDRRDFKGDRAGQIADAIEEAVPELFGDVRHTVRAFHSGQFADDSCKMIGISSEKLTKIRDAGLIPFRQISGSLRAQGLYDAEEIEALSFQRRNSIGGLFVSRRLGVPVYAVEQFAASGVLEQVQSRALALVEFPRITINSIDEIIYRLDVASQKGSVPKGAKPLYLALRPVGGGEKPWSDIMQALLGGKLPYWTSSGSLAVQTLKIMPHDLSHVVSSPKTASGSRMLPGYSRHEAIELLNSTHKRMAEVPSSVLPFSLVRKGHSFCREALLIYARSIITGPELAARLGCTVRTAVNCMKDYPTISNDVLGWDRSAVDQYVAPPTFPHLMPR